MKNECGVYRIANPRLRGIHSIVSKLSLHSTFWTVVCLNLRKHPLARGRWQIEADDILSLHAMPHSSAYVCKSHLVGCLDGSEALDR